MFFSLFAFLFFFLLSFVYLGNQIRKWKLYFKFFKFFSFYCCSGTIVSVFPFTTPLHPSHPHFPPSILPPPFGFVHVSFIHVPENPSLFSPCYPHPTHLWLLSVCSLFQCLWFYFTYLFVLLIRFYLQVKSYGICPSLPGLFHLASVSYTHLTLPTRRDSCRSRWSPYH